MFLKRCCCAIVSHFHVFELCCLSRNKIEVFQIPNPKYNPEEENSAFYVCVVAIKPAVSDLKVIQNRGVKVVNEMTTFDKEDQERNLQELEETIE